MTHHYPTAALWALVIIMTTMLSGCTYTELQYGDDARLVSWRLWTDTSASLTTPELDASYSSDADTAAAASMNKILLDALIGQRLVATGAGL